MRIITTLKEKGELSSHECCLETTVGSDPNVVNIGKYGVVTNGSLLDILRKT